MRKIYTLIFVLISFFHNNTQASHIMGMDISYKCLGNNTYHITLSFYRDCAGFVTPGPTLSINYSSVSCGQSGTLVLNQVGTVTNVSPICAAQASQTTCSGGTLPGVEQYIYEGDLTFPTVCNDWIVYYEDCCRNSAITNIAGASSYGIRIEARIDNTNNLCDNSPVFTTLPIPYICANQPYNYNHGAFDIDGDSLVFTLISPMDWLGGAPIPYIFPFASSYPLSTTTGSVIFNSSTGQMSFTPDATQITVVAVRVDEYRNGVWVGSTTRDIQLSVITCNNQVSTMSSPVNVNGGYATGPTSFEVCPGQALSFQVTNTDPDVGQILTVTSNLSNVIPTATMTTVGTNPAISTFFWQPSGADTGFHSFTLTVQDDACPIVGQQVYSFQIYVLAGTSAGPDITICGNMTAQLQATGGTSFTWTPATGLNNPNVSNPIATPTQTTTYVVSSNLTGGCSNSDTMVVYIVPDFTFTVTPTLDTICLNQQSQLSIVGSANGSPYTYSWTPVSSLLGANTSAPSASPAVTTTYNVSITNSGGCTKTGSAVVFVAGIAPPLNLVASPQTICVGQTSQLDINPSSGGNFCTPTYSFACSSGDFVDNFSFNTLVNNASGCSGNVNNYTYYAGAPTTTVNLGSSYPISMQSGSLWGQGFGVWIDYNQNGSFADPGEFVYTSGLSALTAFNGNVVIPVTAIPGWTRLRVLCRYSAVPVATDYCGASFTFGECEDYDIYIDGGNLTYLWSPASSLSNATIKNPVASPIQTTTYSLTVTSGGYCSNTDTVIVNVITNYQCSAGNDTSICMGGGSAQLNGSNAVTYSWTSIPAGFTSSISNPVVSPLGNTTYVLYGLNASGCGDYDTVVVNFIPLPGFSAGVDQTMCWYDSVQMVPTGTWVNYAWIPTANISDPAIAQPFASPATTTTYTLTVTDANGCAGFDSVVIFVLQPMNLNVSPDTITCMGVGVNVSVDQGVTFLWEPSLNSNPTSQSTTLTPVLPTTYTISVTDTFGCFNIDSVVVDIYVPPLISASIDVSILQGEQTILTAYMTGGVSFIWQPSEGDGSTTSSFTVSPLNTTTYTVMGTSINGCTNWDDVVVTVLSPCQSLMMPNVFSPNSDGRNDLLQPYIVGIEVVTRYEVYDRWGERVFFDNDAKKGWDGKNNNGDDCAVGVYIYNIVTECEGISKVYKGNVTLIK
ncbi:MAG: gliding motility-associated C-terminal domain-containing protein [Sphingobacteriales bacterium]|nr:MAG: gliding motility-associated C-terminal domain-containing protein [Sphingobacteriales bacterium]